MGRDLIDDCLLCLLLTLDDDSTLLSSMWLPRGEWMGVKIGEDVGSIFGGGVGSFIAKNFSEKAWS